MEDRLDKELVSYYANDVIDDIKKGRKQRPFKRKIKIGRNELCPCGSGKKFKRCCLDNIR